jgi:hypothetical protein
VAKIQYIRKILAAFMLIMFAFSITPKLLLHDLIANHRDTPLKNSTDKNARIDVAGFNCSCDNLVVESPFVEDVISAGTAVPIFYAQHNESVINRINSVSQFYFRLRGPPMTPVKIL